MANRVSNTERLWIASSRCSLTQILGPAHALMALAAYPLVKSPKSISNIARTQRTKQPKNQKGKRR